MSNQTMVEQQRNPTDAVFTTCLLNDGKILDADLHFQRIHDHAERLRILDDHSVKILIMTKNIDQKYSTHNHNDIENKSGGMKSDVVTQLADFAIAYKRN